MQQRTYITILLAAALLTAAGCGSESEKETPAPLVRTMTVGDVARSEAGYTGAVRRSSPFRSAGRFSHAM